jgi:hypothetical protein
VFLRAKKLKTLSEATIKDLFLAKDPGVAAKLESLENTSTEEALLVMAMSLNKLNDNSETLSLLHTEVKSLVSGTRTLLHILEAN